MFTACEDPTGVDVLPAVQARGTQRSDHPPALAYLNGYMARQCRIPKLGDGPNPKYERCIPAAYDLGRSPLLTTIEGAGAWAEFWWSRRDRRLTTLSSHVDRHCDDKYRGHPGSSTPWRAGGRAAHLSQGCC